MGDNNDPVDVAVCQGAYTNGEMGKAVSVNGTSLKANDKAIPCGRLPSRYPKGAFNVYNVDANV